MSQLTVKKLVLDTRQLTRLVVIAGALLALAVAGFAGYYYYDRFYSADPDPDIVMIQQAEKALAQDPSSVEKRVSLAQLYMFNTRYQDAITLAGQAMLSDPENQVAWLVLGMSYALKGEPAAAVEPLQRYVDANKDADMPGLNRALQSAAYYLGDSYLKLGQTEKAVEHLELAVAWSKTDADSMYKLGLAYTRDGQYENALLMLHSATVFVPNFVEAYEAMAEVYSQTDRPEYAAFAQGMVAYSRKDFPTALKLLKASVESLPEYSPAWAGLGLAHEATGSLLDAQSAFGQAAALDDTNYTAIRGLDRVTKLLNK